MDKKSLALLILKKNKPEKYSKEQDSEELDSEDSEDSDNSGKLSAIEDFISAVHSKDAEAALEAFESLLEMC